MPVQLVAYEKDPRRISVEDTNSQKPKQSPPGTNPDHSDFPVLPKIARPDGFEDFQQSSRNPMRNGVSDDDEPSVPKWPTFDPNRNQPNPKLLTFEFIRMLKIPLEIRESIWEWTMRKEIYLSESRRKNHAFHLKDAVAIRGYDTSDPKHPRFLPSICHVAEEAIPVFIRNSTFMIASYNGNQFFRKFLETVPNGVGHVRSLRFEFFDCFPEGVEKNSDLELASDCHGLHTLEMSFHYTKVTKVWYDDVSDTWRAGNPREVKDLVAQFRLKNLLGCASLRKIIWRSKGMYGRDTLEALERLGEWAKEEFRRQKQDITNIYV